MKDKVTCMQLWKKWEQQCPDSLKVAETQRRIANYEKADWQDMITDSSLVIDKLKYLVVNDIDINSEESKEAFDYLCKHISTYFFDPDIEYLGTMHLLLRIDRDYISFFNGFQDGLARRLANMMEIYINETISQSTRIMVQ
jgi:hypothetical protein